MKINVKYATEYLNTKKQLGLFLILVIFCSFSFSFASFTNKNTFQKVLKERQSIGLAPSDILRFTQSDANLESKLKIDLTDNDPMKYLQMKREILKLYGGSETDYSFRQNQEIRTSLISNTPPVPAPTNNLISESDGASRHLKIEELQIRPYEVGKFGLPLQKVYSDKEEIVPMKNLIADSNYVKFGKNKEAIQKFDASNVMEAEKFWCSSGSHDVKDEVKFLVEFPKSYPLTALWIHWAFAPGEFKIMYSNDKKQWFDLLGGYRLSVKNGDVNWWRSVLLNPKNRWKYKSFDERINFDEPFFAKYVEINMRIPVNQYFGIFNMEFYTKSKSLVMIKSKSLGEDLCLSVTNGVITNGSPVMAINCLQAISYGDGRELWELNSNGYITTFKKHKCLQSPNQDSVNIESCSTASDYKDDREKWLVEYDGKIRSVKEQFTCLNLVDFSNGDNLLPSEYKVTATSTQNSLTNQPENALDIHSNSFWASNPSNTPVIYEVYFHKYPIIISKIVISWKFPAKKFIVEGMLADGYWKEFFKTNNNRETTNEIQFSYYDLMGIKITMEESTTKFEEKNFYGISFLSIHSGARGIKREPCTQLLSNSNLWELVYVNNVNDVHSNEYKKAWSELHVTRNKFKYLKKFFMKIPNLLISLKQHANDIHKKYNKVENIFSGVKLKLTEFQTLFNTENIEYKTYASSSSNPAYDCSHIIKTFPSKRSGYYWIKNECMPKSLRVYCDFDSYGNKGGLDYYIFNDELSVNSPLINLKNVKDVRLMCNKLGLENLEIKNYKILKIVMNLLKKSNFNLKADSGNFIPLGYDYSCDHSTCSKLFRSFNTRKSSDINNLLSAHQKEGNQNNILSSLFDKVDVSEDDINNTAFLGSNFKIYYGSLSKKNKIAVLCSTNKDGSKEQKKYMNLECDSTLRTENWGNLSSSSHIKFTCPKNCALVKSQVYGNLIYTDNSSVCQAAIHSGAINDAEGGIIEVGIMPGRSNYKGSSSHNIESLDYVDYWDRSFSVSKYQPFCPINKIKDYANSMGINTSSFLSINEKNQLIENIESNIQSQISEIIKKEKSNNLPGTKESSIKVKKLMLASELLKFVQKNQVENLSDSIQPNLSEKTTDEAIVSISAINNKDIKIMKDTFNIASTFKILIGKSSNQIENLFSDKNFGLNTLSRKISNLDSKLKDIKELIAVMDSRSQIQLKQAEHNTYLLKSKSLKSVRTRNFEENYSALNVLENYSIFNSKKGIGEPPKWDYYMYNIEGHLKTIHQVGEFIDNRTGSHLIIKNRDFYDFEIKFSVLLKGSKTFGICFRYVDAYNYYIFELSNIGKGFKRVRKVLRGELRTIDVKYDGGFLEDTWYNVKIRGRQNQFEVSMATENISKSTINYEKVFSFIDNQLVHGTFAFASNGLKSLLLDNISAIHLDCKDNDKKYNEILNTLTPDCPRFKEDLKNSFKYYWKTIDPLNQVNGPSNWIKKEVDFRTVLAQTSKIQGLSDNEEGTIYFMDIPSKVCSKGLISFKAKAHDSGIVGAVFRLNRESSSNDYYLIEISGGDLPNQKFIRLRRKIGSNYSLLSIKPLIGYSKENWFKVIIYMNKNVFNVYFADSLQANPEKVFENDIYDNEISYGNFGLMTFKTRAYFYEISLDSLKPSDEFVDEKIYVDYEKLNLQSIKLPEKRFSKLNSGLSNFSWGRCIKNISPHDKLRMCDIIFKNPVDIQKCNNNYCDSCCDNSTDVTNSHYSYLCKKQCKILEVRDIGNNDTNAWKQCFQPDLPEKSVYPYCEKVFFKDYFQTTRCKIDMCNLCCASFDFTAKKKISKLKLNSCYKGCLKTFDKKPDKR